MSYCRWSSCDFDCDVYVYEDVHGGWTTHVASRRHVIAEPLPEPVRLPRPFTNEQFNAWYARSQAASRAIDAAELVDIGLPHDGRTFNDPTPGECADRLEVLREMGYHVPQFPIDALREEAAEVAP